MEDLASVCLCVSDWNYQVTTSFVKLKLSAGTYLLYFPISYYPGYGVMVCFLKSLGTRCKSTGATMKL